MKSEHKVIFYGSSSLSLTVLKNLISSFNVVAIVTQPDKPEGRKMIIKNSSIKELAIQHHIPVLTPNKLDLNFQDELSHINADIGIIAAYGKIIPKKVLNHPKHGCYNIHPSILPKYRGATPVQSAIRDGLKQTGITFIKMDEGLDDGDIIKVVKVEILDTYNVEILMSIVAQTSAREIISLIPLIISNKVDFQKQNETEATYCFIKDFTLQKGQINFNLPVNQVSNHIRSFSPRPSAWTTFNLKKLYIQDFEILDTQEKFFDDSGIMFIRDNMLIISCIEGNLLIKILQIEGKNSIYSKNFINGYQKDLPAKLLTI